MVALSLVFLVASRVSKNNPSPHLERSQRWNSSRCLGGKMLHNIRWLHCCLRHLKFNKSYQLSNECITLHILTLWRQSTIWVSNIFRFFMDNSDIFVPQGQAWHHSLNRLTFNHLKAYVFETKIIFILLFYSIFII